MPSPPPSPGPFRPARLGGREVPVLWLAGDGPDPVGLALARAERFPADATRDAMAHLAAGRIGGPAGLPDPGGAALGVAPRAAAIVITGPGQAARLAAARAGGLPVVLARDPFDPAGDGAGPHDPWTLLDAAAELHGAGRELALLALAAGVSLADGPFAGADRLATWGAILAATRGTDPFTGAPCEIARGLDILGLWKRAAATGAGIAACLAVHPYKRARITELLGRDAPPSFHWRPAAAIAAARRAGGGLLAWSAAAPPDLPARCAEAGVALTWLEDGFIRSAGLGASFRAGASFALDGRGPYYDPALPTDLEALLAEGRFDAALLARAAAFRQAIVARGITKYNLQGAAPRIAAPPGRRRILVPGQVADDASVARGGGAIRDNLALLRAVRAAEPEAFLVYKPHPDIEAGFRRGRIPRAALAGLADQVLVGAPIHAVLGQVDAVHTLTSLTGFEALLRGVPVTCWGGPFYAGWGLTTDRGAALPRRARRLALDELVAGALLLYPRCIDPLTRLPCPPEVLLARMDRPDLFPRGERGWLRAAEGFGRRMVARAMGWR